MPTIQEPREARPFLPYDVPMIYRLTPHGISLDSAMRLTRGINTVEGAVMSAVPLADLGTPTFVIRGGEMDGFIGQFRHKSGDVHAHLTFIAPEPDSDEGEREWLALLDTMVNHAAKRGASRLHAETEENSPAHEVMVRAGFSTIARQQIWGRMPEAIGTEPDTSYWRPAAEQDSIGIMSLYHLVVPRIVAQAEPPLELKTGTALVLERDGRIMGWLGVQKGSSGIYLIPCLHSDLAMEAEPILNEALYLLKGADKNPVFIPIRRYHGWLESALVNLRFESGYREAVMARQAEVRVEKPAFALSRYTVRAAVASVGVSGSVPDRARRFSGEYVVEFSGQFWSQSSGRLSGRFSNQPITHFSSGSATIDAGHLYAENPTKHLTRNTAHSLHADRADASVQPNSSKERHGISDH